MKSPTTSRHARSTSLFQHPLPQPEALHGLAEQIAYRVLVLRHGPWLAVTAPLCQHLLAEGVLGGLAHPA